MSEIKTSIFYNPTLERAAGTQVELIEQWKHTFISIHEQSSLEEALLEQIRKTLAVVNNSEVCMGEGQPNIYKSNAREKLATSFAELYAKDHLSIHQAHIKFLKEEFSNEEIHDLCKFISLTTAVQKLCYLSDLVMNSN